MSATSNNDVTDIEIENDPIKTNNRNSKFLIDNEDAIIYDLKKNKKE